jgi:hypothetical protein
MNENVEQNIQEPLIYEISDEMLEIAAHTDDGNLGKFTQWLCTAVYFCPGGKADVRAASVCLACLAGAESGSTSHNPI